MIYKYNKFFSYADDMEANIMTNQIFVELINTRRSSSGRRVSRALGAFDQNNVISLSRIVTLDPKRTSGKQKTHVRLISFCT